MANEKQVRILANATASRIIGHELTRRGFIGATVAVGTAGLLAACTPTGGTSTAPGATGGPLESGLSIYTWGDYDDPELLTQFTSDSGPQITLDSFNSNEEMISKLIAARGTSGYDIVVPTGVYLPQMIENGLLSELNLDLIPNLEHMDPAFLNQDWDPGNRYSICKAWGTTGFVYDNTVITRDLRTWEDFIDAAQNEASGKTSVLDDPTGIVGLYFWSKGIDWTTSDPAQLDECEDFLVNTLAKHVAAFDSYPGGAAIPQASHVLMQSWNGDARIGIMESDDPDRWEWRLGAPDTELWMDNWCIVEGSPNPEAAHAFINFVLDPEVQLVNLDYIGYHTGARGIEDAASDMDMLDLVFFDEAQVATMHPWRIGESQQRVVDIWNAMRAAAGA
ncbi:MAG TPA: spermidine/putrescine ABC transporter substrate-binding protein [Terrimesophilobacter sp.]|nr:spermidine/putrescine ABC transporter substrate-binding protein [Terrimesophilobacter sp.]